MPFIAKLKSTDEEINILNYRHPRLSLRHNDIICRFCSQDMYIRGGEDRQVCSHFVHKIACQSNIDYRKDQHPESAEHLMLKKLIFEQLSKEFSEYSDATPHLEYRIKENGIYRIIDVAMIFPLGWIIAHEVQLSQISIIELEKRTDDYANAGIDVVWWFGKKADTQVNRDWSINRFGSVFCVNLGIPDDAEERCLYTIKYPEGTSSSASYTNWCSNSSTCDGEKRMEGLR